MFAAVKDGGFNSLLEYAGDDASYPSDVGKMAASGQSMASESFGEAQPLWTAQLRASLTQIYEKCSMGVPGPLQRPSHLRPLFAVPETESSNSKSELGPPSSESDLSANNLA